MAGQLSAYSFISLMLTTYCSRLTVLVIAKFRTLSEESPLQSDAVLMTQLELVENYTLQDWLKHHSLKRRKSTVINFFEQVRFIVFYTMD